jgi:hypothetical protein
VRVNNVDLLKDVLKLCKKLIEISTYVEFTTSVLNNAYKLCLETPDQYVKYLESQYAIFPHKYNLNIDFEVEKISNLILQANHLSKPNTNTINNTQQKVVRKASGSPSE